MVMATEGGQWHYCMCDKQYWLVARSEIWWMNVYMKYYISEIKKHPAAHSRRMLTVGMLAHKYFHQWAIFKYPKIVYSSQYQCQN